MFPKAYRSVPLVCLPLCSLLWDMPLRAAEPDLGQLRTQFESKDRAVRFAAIQGASALGSAALPLLEQIFLADGSESHYPGMREERLLALKALAGIRAPDAIPVLLLAAADLEKPVREEAQRQLLQEHKLSLDQIRREWLFVEDWFVRRGAQITLQDHGTGADALLKDALALVAAKKGERRLAAVQLLGQLELAAAIPSLQSVVSDSSETLPLRLEALGALHHLDGRQVPLPAWTLALGQEGMRGLYLATLSGVHIAMSHLEAAGSKAVPVLIETLANEDPLKRMRAACVLGRMGKAATPALPALHRLAKDRESFVSLEALRAIPLIDPEENPRPAVSLPPAPADNAPVVFHETAQTLILENGSIRCEIDKAKGSLISIQKSGDGRNLFGEKGAWYGTFPWTLPRGMGVPRFVETSAYIARQSEDLVEAVVKLRLEKPRPLTQEQHYVVRRGVSGVYQFAVFSKPAESTPEPSAVFDYGRFMKADAGIFRWAAVSDSLQGELLSPERYAQVKVREQELSNATYRLADGRLWAKYSWCNYEQASKVHGASGDGVGLWVIMPNDESGYNLPSNHPGTVHEGGASIVMVTHQEGVPHNIGSEQRASIHEAPWQKLYGPLLLYVNSGANHATMWTDAKRRADLESAAHPAPWMEHPLYPKTRATLRGRVLTASGNPAAGAWVIVCHPHPDSDRAWQRHKGPYTYRTFADQNGRFEISGIRADTYSVIARMDGLLGTARQDGVALAEGEQKETGVLTIADDERGARLWQIGSPDGTPREFVGAVDSHEWCGWIRNYRRFFPEDVRFVVGKSDPARDWYYCQPGGWPVDYGRESKPTQWSIQFELPSVPEHGVILTMGIAATRGGDLKISCNQNALPARSLLESDYRTSLCMAPDRGAFYGFRTERIPIQASQLRSGSNELTLSFGSGKNRFEAIMYDFIRLEAAK